MEKTNKKYPFQYGRAFCPLAGVTFANSEEDGGQERQDILKEIYDKGSPVMAKIRHCTWEGEPAAKVIIGKNTVAGWIPKKNVDNCKNTDKMILRIQHKKRYTGLLYMPDPPSAKLYAIVHDMYKKGKIKTIPPYSRILYAYAVADCMNQKPFHT